MAAVGWVRLTKFRMPFTYRIKCKLSRLLTRGRIRASYERNPNSVLIRIQFDGAYLETVLERFSGLIREWGRQNHVQV